jgi:hypothetical protein
MNCAQLAFPSQFSMGTLTILGTCLLDLCMFGVRYINLDGVSTVCMLLGRPAISSLVIVMLSQTILS